MSIELKIPHLGESISEVQIAEWLKGDGEEVKKDENVAIIDSEKTTLELPAPENGRLKILHQSGETVQIGETVARIESGTNPADAPAKQSKEAKTKTETNKSSTANSSAPAKEAKPETENEGEAENVETPDESQPNQPQEADSNAEPVMAKVEIKSKKTSSTSSKKSAPPTESAPPAESKSQPKPQEEEDQIKPSPETSEPTAPEVTPTVKKSATPSVAATEKIVPMTILRRTVAKRLVEAKQVMAMLTTFNEVDLSAVQALRKEHQDQFEKRYQVKLGFMSFFVKAVIGALKQFPQLNAEIRDHDIVYHQRFDIGVAIASERGLVVPVLRDADEMSFAEIEKAIGDFARRAREGKLKPSDLEGATFTITNGGVFGSLLSTPIINPPQSGILGMHSIQDRPIAMNGQVVIRPMMFIALTYDHRLVDGREAVLFLCGVRDAIANPARILMEI